MMGRKRRCPGCKTILSNHSFGPASKHCDGPVAAFAEADELDAAAVPGTVVVNTVEEINEDSLNLASGLSPSLEAQREQNKKLRNELASL